MNLIYENELGSILMSGGGSGGWRVVSVSGLDLPSMREQAAVYAYEDGQEFLSGTADRRIITIKGDLQTEGSDLGLITNAAKVISRGGRLKITKENKTRTINCRVRAFEPQIRRGDTREFVLQLVCDNPYFTDGEKKKSHIYHQIKLLHGTFSFGTGIQFSRSVAGTFVVNTGHVKCEPVFYVTNLGTSMAPTDSLTIINKTTGQRITVNYPMAAKETIIVDVAGRDILNGGGDSIVHFVSDDTSLSNFHLETGINELTAESTSKISALCVHQNRYSEAII